MEIGFASRVTAVRARIWGLIVQEIMPLAAASLSDAGYWLLPLRDGRNRRLRPLRGWDAAGGSLHQQHGRHAEEFAQGQHVGFAELTAAGDHVGDRGLRDGELTGKFRLAHLAFVE